MTDVPPLALLAGGLATRLRPLTEKVPKSLLEVAGEPFVAHQLRLFRAKGVGRVVICAGYLGEMIREFVGAGDRFQLSVEYSFDGDRLLGTGGALRKALPLLGREFMVVYGDSWLDTNYGALAAAFRSAGKPAMMTVFRNDGAWDASNVEFDGTRILAYDKRVRTPRMRHIDWGLGMFRPEVFAGRAAEQEFDLANLYMSLVKRGELAGLEVRERFYEIGSAAGMAETERHLRQSYASNLQPPNGGIEG